MMWELEPIQKYKLGEISEPIEKSLKGETPTYTGYKLQDRTKIHGMDIGIENKKGSWRKWGDKENEKTLMKFDYGYIRNTLGRDKDHIDCYIGPNQESEKVFIVHQIDPKTQKHDEDKVMLGWDKNEDAKKAYLAHIPKKWFGSIDELTVEEFKKKVIGKKVNLIKGEEDEYNI